MRSTPFSPLTTIYPSVSDTRNREKTTIYPYRMASPDLPRGAYKRSTAVIRGFGSSRDDYRREVEDRIRYSGSYAAWLDTLEIEQPTTVSAIIGGSVEENRLARRQAQAAYDAELGIGAASEAQVNVGGDDDGLGAALDAIGDQAESLVDKARANPGYTAAIIGGAVLLFLVARRR
jgi:hypothetical protein